MTSPPDPKPLAPEAALELSVKASGRKHPSVLYLMKMFKAAKKLPRLVHEEDREYRILDCEVPKKGGGKLRLGLVFVGEAE